MQKKEKKRKENTFHVLSLDKVSQDTASCLVLRDYCNYRNTRYLNGM